MGHASLVMHDPGLKPVILRLWERYVRAETFVLVEELEGAPVQAHHLQQV